MIRKSLEKNKSPSYTHFNLEGMTVKQPQKQTLLIL